MKAMNYKAWMMTIASILVGAFCMLLICQISIAMLDQGKVNDYADSIIARADEVVTESMTSIEDIHAYTFIPCSPEDIFQLRYLVFNAHYLHDIGRLKNNALVCTAVRGIIDPPIPLPKADMHQADGVRLWSGVTGLSDARIQTDIASRYDIAVFTAPSAFQRFTLPVRGYSALLISADNGHVYQSFGAIQSDVLTQPSTWYNQYRQQRRCSNTHDVCIYARLNDSGVLALKPGIIVAIVLAGAAIGGGISMLLLLLIERDSLLCRQLLHAVKKHELYLEYQPIVCMKRMQIIGVESLVRWNNKGKDPISPEVFIPIAEQQGIINEITHQVTDRALAELQAILQKHPAFYVSINLDISDVLDDDFRNYLNAQVEKYGLSRRQIMLEVTERSTAAHAELADKLNALRQEGYRIALDDFGTGYCNLSYLSSLPFDTLKIDKMFTSAIGTGSVNAKIVDLLFKLTADFNTSVTVEGVETPEQAEYIRQHSPNAAVQGWHFGYPMSAEVLEEKYF